jgi:hypothetical protein
MQRKALKIVNGVIEKQPELLMDLKVKECLDDLQERVNQFNQQVGSAI